MLNNILIALFILSCVLHGTSFDPEKQTIEDKTSFLKDTLPDDVYEVVEEMPRFPGCEEIDGDIDAKKQCADKKMLAFIYKNIKFLSISKDCIPDGMIVIQFIIDEQGKIIDPKVIRAMESCGKEVIGNSLELIEMMNNLPQPWTAGKQRGKPVKVAFNLPMRINFSD